VSCVEIRLCTRLLSYVTLRWTHLNFSLLCTVLLGVVFRSTHHDDRGYWNTDALWNAATYGERLHGTDAITERVFVSHMNGTRYFPLPPRRLTSSGDLMDSKRNAWGCNLSVLLIQFLLWSRSYDAERYFISLILFLEPQLVRENSFFLLVMCDPYGHRRKITR
jgi:hypothetical protein